MKKMIEDTIEFLAILLIILFAATILDCKGQTIPIFYPSSEEVTDTFATIDNKGTVDIVIKTQDLIFISNRYGYMCQLYNRRIDDNFIFIPYTGNTVMIRSNDFE